jgi:hypothetical protein
MLIDLRLFNLIFDDIALNFFNRSFYVLSGIIIVFEVDFMYLLLLIYVHRHINIKHNSNMLYIYDNLYHQFFLIIRHIY